MRTRTIKKSLASLVIMLSLAFQSCNGANKSQESLAITKSNVMPENTNETETAKPLYFVAFVYYKEGGKQKMEEFRKKSSKLWKKYDLEHLYTIKVSTKNAIIGANTMEQPDEIFIQVANDPSKFGQYIQDPEYLKIKSIREEGVRKMTYVMGTNIDIPMMKSMSKEENRLYGLGMIYYKPNGEQKMMEFGQKAAPLFGKHKLYAERFIAVIDKGAVIGTADDFTLPDEVRIFFADTPQNLNDYISDPAYNAIKGIREEGVADYPTFLGMYEKVKM